MNDSKIRAAKGETAKKARRAQKRRRGVLDLPKAIEERLAEGRVERESVPLEAHGDAESPAACEPCKPRGGAPVRYGTHAPTHPRRAWATASRRRSSSASDLGSKTAARRGRNPG
jgi:hypothetical protein